MNLDAALSFWLYSKNSVTLQTMNILLSLLAAAELMAAIVNPTWSPDSSKIAFTRDNDLYVVDVAVGDTLRLTHDGSDTIKNGYASWVYYEEIFGRGSNYRSFWWSPDSKKLAYYRFDDSEVDMFPIYSPFGQQGRLNNTRYPKAGRKNPAVQVRIAEILHTKTAPVIREHTVFDNADSDCYYGTPFWSSDSKELYVSIMPRRQNQLDIIAADIRGNKRQVYHEEYPTWIEWIDDMVFTEKGFFMARDFESSWQQIYFLGFDGKLQRLTDGQNWDIRLLKYDHKKQLLWFTARRDSRLHPSLYVMDLKKDIKSNGMTVKKISSLTNPQYWVSKVEIDDKGTFTALCSNASTPWFKIRGNASGRILEEEAKESPSDGPRPELVTIENDGFTLYALVNLPKDFDPTKKYPVLMEVYGGPGTAYVRDRWNDRDASNRWCWEHGIIYMVTDPRSSGENGRRGMDQAHCRMTVTELQDYVAWARYMQSLPYVQADRIGVEGFSFGGTTTAMLVLRYPEYFHCGIAGGGVYDWHLYDTHYTERYMCIPDENPEGYDEACVLKYVKENRISPDYKPFHLKITHGTGDDNVHFQNTLQLIDALQTAGVLFDLMIYPDGMHGYRGKQKEHSDADDHAFLLKNLFE